MPTGTCQEGCLRQGCFEAKITTFSSSFERNGRLELGRFKAFWVKIILFEERRDNGIFELIRNSTRG